MFPIDENIGSELLCYNLPQTWQLQTMHIYYLEVSVAQSLDTAQLDSLLRVSQGSSQVIQAASSFRGFAKEESVSNLTIFISYSCHNRICN